jgi:hypothetical protein
MDEAGAIDPEREPIRKVSHGARANYTGNSLEEFVHNTLIRKGYKFVEHRQFDAERFLDQPIFTVHYPVARSIYDTQLFCDFLIFHPDKHAANLIIESKWQQSRGSVDEKFPFLVANIRDKYPHAIICQVSFESRCHDVFGSQKHAFIKVLLSGVARKPGHDQLLLGILRRELGP